MNWIIVSLSSLVLASIGTGAGIIWWQLQQIRTSGAVTTATDWLGVVQAHIDYSYAWFSIFFARLAHNTSFYSLLATRRLVVWCKTTLARVEHRCSHLIETFAQRQVTAKRGAASLFLLKIKEGQTSIISQS
jgi:hypothetical protein